MPFLFIIVGLFDVWVPKEKIQKHIGQESGIKGIVLVVLLAMLQAGPLYGAFPVAYLLYRKGASIRNIFIYLGAFSSMKIPMLGIEIGYLGIRVFTGPHPGITTAVYWYWLPDGAVSEKQAF